MSILLTGSLSPNRVYALSTRAQKSCRVSTIFSDSPHLFVRCFRYRAAGVDMDKCLWPKQLPRQNSARTQDQHDLLLTGAWLVFGSALPELWGFSLSCFLCEFFTHRWCQALDFSTGGTPGASIPFSLTYSIQYARIVAAQNIVNRFDARLTEPYFRHDGSRINTWHPRNQLARPAARE